MRVVVVGYGMAGARFTDELLATGAACEVTVLAAEPPYNRALLTEVIAGRATTADLRARPRPGVTVRDAAAERLDLRRGVVADSNGDEHPFDHLVLATGAAPVVPPVPGLAGGLPAGCHTIRTEADAEAVIAGAAGARRAVVLGGGVLGVETAAALAGQGTAVTLVHDAEVLLDRHLGLAAGRRLNRAVRNLGIEVVLNAETARVDTVRDEPAPRGTAHLDAAVGRPSGSARDRGGERFRALRLAGGAAVHGDLLVVTCGVQPDTGLAARAGLLLGRNGGIVVDDTLSCPDDPRVHAIGDCAEIDGRCTGLVEPAWDQAAVLARRLAGGIDRHTPGPEVLRVKAPGLEVMVLGESRGFAPRDGVPTPSPQGANPDSRSEPATTPGSAATVEPAAGVDVVTLADPAGIRYVRAVLRDGFVEAAVAIDAPGVAAELVLLADRRTPVCGDPAAILSAPAEAAPGGPSAGGTAPGGTVGGATAGGAAGKRTVCRCNGVTRAAITAAWEGGATSVAEVARQTRATTGCGGCSGAVGDLLERLSSGEPSAAEDETAPARRMTMSELAKAKHVVVVGGGMVAHRLVEALRSRDTENTWRVTVLAEEPRLPYDRVALTTYFSGRDPQDLALGEPELWDDPGVTLRKGVVATGIDPVRRTVSTSRGETIGYDELVLATGSYPFVPPVKGSDLTGCFVYRTVDDVAALRTYVEELRTRKSAVRGVVVGGGLLGLEAAGALRALGADTTVVEFAPRLMPLQVDEGGGAALRRLIEDLDVQVSTAAQVTKVKAAPGGAVRAVSVADADDIATDVVVFAAGVRPRDELVRNLGDGADAGLRLGERGGVVVDEGCRTGADGIWAIGEVACIEGRVWGLVAPGYAMAEVVADRLLGGAATFPGADSSTKLKLLGVDVASFGDAFGATEGALDIVYADPVAGVYKKLVLSDDARTLLGGILVGDASAYAALRPMTGRPLGADPASYLLPEGAQPAATGDLPDDAPVCSCNNVSAGRLRCAVRDEGCQDVKSLCVATKAGTSCGSCLPIVKNVLNAELTAAGVTVSKALCEHFALSRAELFDVVRVTGLRTFSEIVDRHGTGRGCDICKPVVASILASLDPAGHVLEGERATLQDTNDHVMANLQKDGTYSVVPRIPGGEITPEKLIVIGEVARDFGLYTKITGGQRIDLFGARIEQLPAIWKRLVDVGFESGHAYGKAVRTVKSCVGSTWCRYGVQDSVGMAIALELRYRGLRSPHKLKLGVSGCARECAEARGKDVGVIATENGWNLYVGGNGGMTPRHAELLASDLTDDELFTAIDRFLMYYVRTGDRLQRTSVWIREIEGGLDHVRDVVMNDSLGIAADLDAAMAAHIGSYTDEWKATLDDPDKLARFVSFVNAPDQPDADLRYVVERDQPRPATERDLSGPVMLAGPRLEVHP
ncbi:MAG TPA: nitrite reductase large subunit NirB [Kribbellaceae bacterium]